MSEADKSVTDMVADIANLDGTDPAQKVLAEEHLNEKVHDIHTGIAQLFDAAGRIRAELGNWLQGEDVDIVHWSGNADLIRAELRRQEQAADRLRGEGGDVPGDALMPPADDPSPS